MQRDWWNNEKSDRLINWFQIACFEKHLTILCSKKLSIHILYIYSIIINSFIRAQMMFIYKYEKRVGFLFWKDPSWLSGFHERLEIEEFTWLWYWISKRMITLKILRGISSDYRIEKICQHFTLNVYLHKKYFFRF